MGDYPVPETNLRPTGRPVRASQSGRRDLGIGLILSFYRGHYTTWASDRKH
jgi:hypothetical protein